jgi:hypothetical protein
MLLDDETGRRLLANDPAVQKVSISSTATDKNLAALCHSTHVEHLYIDMQAFHPLYQSLLNGDIENLSGTALGQVLEWLQQHMSVLTYVQMGGFGPHVVDLLHLFLPAMGVGQTRGSSSSSLVALALVQTQVAARDLVALLDSDNGVPVRELHLMDCHIVNTTFCFESEAEAVRLVAQRFALCPTLERLVLDINAHNEVYFGAIVRALQMNTHIQTLCVRHNMVHPGGGTAPIPTNASNAMIDLFQSSSKSSLRSIRFLKFAWAGDDSLAALAQSLRTSPLRLESIWFEGCCLLDDEACQSFCSMLDRGDSLAPLRLSLHGNVEFPNQSRNYLTNLMVNCLPTVRQLCLTGFGESVASKKRLRAIFCALTSDKCPIHRLLVAGHCDFTFSELLKVLPKVPNLTFVSCVYSRDGRDETTVEEACLLRTAIHTAFRRNRSVWDSILSPSYPADRCLLRAYHDRNRHLLAQVECAKNAFKGSGRGSVAAAASLLPRLFKVDERAGPGPQQALATLVNLGDRVGPHAMANKRIRMEQQQQQQVAP